MQDINAFTENSCVLPQKEDDASSDPWQAIPVPQGIVIDCVKREPSTHGYIYTIWYTPYRQVVWISQSIPAMVKKINALLTKTKEDKLHASSIYRIIRGECSRKMHKHYRAMKWARNGLLELNEFVQQFDTCIFISKCPDQWHISSAEKEKALASPASKEKKDDSTSAEKEHGLPTKQSAKQGIGDAGG